jgi:phosphoribosyl 1,2-cyclic phosphodiesterase
MLEHGRYPIHLKNRIRNGEGHLSNRQALELFLAHRPPHQTHLFLAHLSEQNNHPDKALEAFALYQKDMHISVASRYEASGLYHIRSNNTYPLRPKPSYLGRQMNLFH